MLNSIKARTPILALILFVFAIGYTFAETKVVFIPMAADAPPSVDTPPSMAMYASGEQLIAVTTVGVSVREILFTAPSDGVVIVNSSAAVIENIAKDRVRCSITTGTTRDTTHTQTWESPGSDGDYAQLSGTRGFDVTKDSSYTFRLFCDRRDGLNGGDPISHIEDSSLTAIFIPSA